MLQGWHKDQMLARKLDACRLGLILHRGEIRLPLPGNGFLQQLHPGPDPADIVCRKILAGLEQFHA